MKKKETLLRVCYITGAVLDGFMVFPMVIPQLGLALFGVENFIPGASYKYAMYLGATLMAGWTFLLLWANKKPIERKGILLLTVFPVLAGLFTSDIYA
ncbi:MAG: hypothetical protein KKH98_11925, partial [Spirochaetes bacterium]|nr:hypothetical protein [Spirochaetota bacterium]